MEPRTPAGGMKWGRCWGRLLREGNGHHLTQQLRSWAETRNTWKQGPRDVLAPMFIAALFTGAQGPLRGAQVAKPCAPRVESFSALRGKERLTRYDVLLSERRQARAKSSCEAPRAGGLMGTERRWGAGRGEGRLLFDGDGVSGWQEGRLPGGGRWRLHDRVKVPVTTTLCT